MQTESAFMHRRELFYQKRLLLRARRRLQGWNLHRASGNARRRASYECGSIRRRDETDRRSAEVLTSEGEVLNLTNEELGMGYRTSVIAKNDYVALSAVLKLEKGDRQEIRAYMEDLKERRVTKQPLEFGSAGSTFKRPEGYFAGKTDTGFRYAGI